MFVSLMGVFLDDGVRGRMIEPSATRNGSSTLSTMVSLGFCVTVGVILFLLGWYFLFNPSEVGSSTVNLQRLAVGATASIVGAIFLASAVRPR
jgi:uncharacterized membrane protein HdeD (DUF308 family)